MVVIYTICKGYRKAVAVSRMRGPASKPEPNWESTEATNSPRLAKRTCEALRFGCRAPAKFPKAWSADRRVVAS